MIAALGARRGGAVAARTDGAFVIGNVSARSRCYEFLMAARFFDRPAARGLLRDRRGGRAIWPGPRAGPRGVDDDGRLPVANIIGVPAATWLGQRLGWRAAFLAVAGLAVVTLALVCGSAVPPRDAAATGRRELVGAGAAAGVAGAAGRWVGFGGMFAAYSYIAPTVTDGLAGFRTPPVPSSCRVRRRHGLRHLVGGRWPTGRPSGRAVGGDRGGRVARRSAGSRPQGGWRMPGGLRDHRDRARCSWSTCSCG